MKKSVAFLLCFLLPFLSNAQKRSQSAWQQQVSYQITVDLDDDGHYLNGNLVLSYTNNSPDVLNEIYFHLWPNAYKNLNTAFAKQQLGNGKVDFQFSEESEKGFIDQLNFTSNGESLNWMYDKQHIDIAKVSLNKPLASGASIQIETPFRVKIPKVFSRLGHEGQDYFITQWYPKPAVYDVNGWNTMPYLDQGEFYSEFGDFTVSIELPENYVVAATGELQTASEIAFMERRKDYPLLLKKDSVPPSAPVSKVIVFKAEHVHDFAWFASKKFNIKESSVDIAGKKVITRVVDYNPKEMHLIHIATALNYYSDKIGAYPYSHATVVHGELEAGGGMEYPMITLCDVMNEEVIVHEVGHNWFYGILGSNERQYPWMDESINSFYESRAMAFDDMMSKTNDMNSNVMSFLVKDHILTNEYQAIGLASEEYTWANYGASVYGMGANAFSHLYAYLGRDRFNAAMQLYFQTWKFKHPLPDDMKNAFEASTAENLDWFFNGLLNTNQALDYKLSKAGKDYKLTNKGEIAAPVPVVFTNESGDKKTIWAKAEKGESAIISSPFADVKSVIIDPERSTMDLFPDNDKPGVKIAIKPFIGSDNKGIKEIYAAPALGWNFYDKWMVGGVIHNYSFSNKAIQYHLVPMYSFETNELNGLAKWSYTKAGKGPAAYTEASVEAQKFSWSQLGYNLYNYTKLSPEIVFHLPKASMRSNVNKSLSLRFDHTSFDPSFDVEEERKASFNNNYQILDNWKFASVAYEIKNKDKMKGYTFWLEIEQGMTASKILNGKKDTSYVNSDTIVNFIQTGTSSLNSNHTKLTALLDLKVDIGIKKKPLELRFFASYFFNAPEDGYFKHSIGYTGERAFNADYRFQELSMYRNGGEGMLRNQIGTLGSNSRFVGILGQSDKMMVNMIVSVPMPGKIPLKPYAEFLSYSDIDQSFWNKSETSLIYNLGIELELIPEFFSIYFNVAQSKDVGVYQDSSGIDTFLERATFSLNLRDFTPPKVKQKMKMF